MLHKILFVLQQNLLTESHFWCKLFFLPRPKFSQVSLNFKDAVEKIRGPAVFLPGDKILCSLTNIVRCILILPIIVP